MAFERFKKFLERTFFNTKWTCNVCGREIYNGGFFCDACLKKLPFIDGPFCEHCGRKTINTERYCTTCKNTLVSIDMGRSAFNYQPPINNLIQKYKRYSYKYLADVFAEYLSVIYFKNFIVADYLVFVPMARKSERKRGFNQSKLLAQKLSEITCVPVLDAFIKVRETDNQKSLGRNARFTNLKGAFKLVEKDAINDKTVVIIDDVTTTGATAECLAEKLKKYKAKKVVLLTVASTPPVDGY